MKNAAARELEKVYAEAMHLRGEINCLRAELHSRSTDLYKVRQELKVQSKLNLILVAALEKILLGTVEVAQQRVSQ